MANPVFDSVMPLLRNKKTWIPLYFLVAAWLLYSKKKNGMVIIAGTVVCVALTDIVSSHILKELFERARPCLNPNLMSDTRLLLAHCSNGFSFPSSHAANHFAMALFLSLLMHQQSKLWIYISMLWAAIIGFAQIYVGVHYPADIFFGMLTGFLIALICVFATRKLLKPEK